MQNLVVVESPTKAKTLQRFLGSKYQVEASFGHVRDLPKSDIGVDTEHNFTPRYIIPRDKTKRVKALKKILEQAKIIWLATDPDREGEAIAWHIAQLIGDRTSSIGKSAKRSTIPDIRRVVFHEITPEAITEAFANPRDIDLKLVDAQQARRVLDRLVGYKLSPLLWKKVKAGLSAGRVQSVALRLIIEREDEVKKFVPIEYWSIEASMLTGPATSSVSPARDSFITTLIELNNKKLPIKNKSEADLHLKNLQSASYQVNKITKKEVRRFSLPPFTTSTLQQTASHSLGMTAKRTMMLAQHLYEHGFITYMRTDSVNLAQSAVTAARKYIEQIYGSKFIPQNSRVFKTRSKLAQEAHEAIRPTNVHLRGTELGGDLTPDHIRLYDLIWKRMLASQMSEAVMDQTSVDVTTSLRASPKETSSVSPVYKFRATGSVIKFEGWMKLYGKAEEMESSEDNPQKLLPELKEKQALDLKELLPSQHFTEPQPRFNEASLIKKLEELGIGRPSTYAPILSTIQDRFYVEKQGRNFIPTELGEAVNKFLKQYFSDILDYSFTAEMEDQIDEVAEGSKKWQSLIETFYRPFEKKVELTNEEAVKVKIELETVDEKCPECGKQLVVKIGRFGKFLACPGFPDCKFTKQHEEIVEGVSCPKCQGKIIVKKTRTGRPFFGCANYPKCDFASWTKPGDQPQSGSTVET